MRTAPRSVAPSFQGAEVLRLLRGDPGVDIALGAGVWWDLSPGRGAGHPLRGGPPPPRVNAAPQDEKDSALYGY